MELDEFSYLVMYSWNDVAISHSGVLKAEEGWI